MRAWSGWRLGVAVVGAVCAVGCGVSQGGTHNEPPPNVAESPAPPLESSGEDASVPLPPPDASTLRFEVPACVPVNGTPTGPRFPSPCEVRTRRPDGSLARVERFDAQGHPLEEVSYAPQGGVTERTVHTWTAGLEVHRLTETARGDWSEATWSYDGQGRAVQYALRAGPSDHRLDLRTVYDAQGRVARITRWEDGTRSVREYVYGAAGRLESVLGGTAEDAVLQPVELHAHTYHPNGQLQRLVVTPLHVGGGERQEYDEAGRLVRFESSMHDIGRTEQREYGAHAEPTRVRSSRTGPRGTSERDELRVYDANGRQVVSALVENVHVFLPEERRLQYREVRRSVLACETGALLREELDANADGAADGLRELAYDAAGNLVAERFSGTLETPELGRREYDYHCH